MFVREQLRIGANRYAYRNVTCPTLLNSVIFPMVFVAIFTGGHGQEFVLDHCHGISAMTSGTKKKNVKPATFLLMTKDNISSNALLSHYTSYILSSLI